MSDIKTDATTPAMDCIAAIASLNATGWPNALASKTYRRCKSAVTSAITVSLTWSE